MKRSRTVPRRGSRCRTERRRRVRRADGAGPDALGRRVRFEPAVSGLAPGSRTAHRRAQRRDRPLHAPRSPRPERAAWRGWTPARARFRRSAPRPRPARRRDRRSAHTGEVSYAVGATSSSHFAGAGSTALWCPRDAGSICRDAHDCGRPRRARAEDMHRRARPHPSPSIRHFHCPDCGRSDRAGKRGRPCDDRHTAAGKLLHRNRGVRAGATASNLQQWHARRHVSRR